MAGAVLLAGCNKSGDNVVETRAPQDAPGHTRDFTSVKYFDAAPFQQQMKWRLSGADAQPLGELLVIKQAKMETFNTNGSRQAIGEAPECVYDIKNGVASSAGHLRLQSGDGKARAEGDGFLWRQDDSFLTISNNVRTAIENSPAIKP
jgi:hypothetical protein